MQLGDSHPGATRTAGAAYYAATFLRERFGLGTSWKCESTLYPRFSRARIVLLTRTGMFGGFPVRVFCPFRRLLMRALISTRDFPPLISSLAIIRDVVPTRNPVSSSTLISFGKWCSNLGVVWLGE